ncbi:MAG: M6 family metalloprotease domain-containing protein [bacterium]
MDKRGKLILTGMAILLIIAATVSAAPPHPQLLENIRQTNAELPYALAHRAELLSRGVDAPGADGAVRLLAKQAHAEVVSSYNLLCIMVEFTDKAAAVPAAEFDDLLFSTNPPSVRHFYDEVSYGRLDLVTVNLPSETDWLTAPQTYGYYCGGASGLGFYPTNCQKLVEDLVNLVDPLVNFANYDNDHDGWVDGLTIVHSGKGAEAESSPALTNFLIWSHKWSTSAPMSKDGKLIFDYSIQPEYVFSPGDATIGVFCHELGHAIFGLPDLYDTDYSSNGLGQWSLMATGSWNGPALMGSSPAHFDAWSRVQCGFTDAHNVTANVAGQPIPAIETDSAGVLRLWSNGTLGSQYFLVENRQRVGYDSYLPGEGLLVYHIDDGVGTDNDNEWYPGHFWSGHYRVALEQADNLYQLEKLQSYGDAADAFPGTTGADAFTSITAPAATSYAGEATLVGITNISASAPVMFADLAVQLVAGVDDYDYDPLLPDEFSLEQNFPNPFNPSTRITFELPTAAEVELAVYNLLGERIESLVAGTLPAGQHSISWTAVDESGHSLSSGLYLYRLTTGGLSLTRKMLLLK